MNYSFTVLILPVFFQCLEGGHPGPGGPGVHLSVTLVSRQGRDSAVHQRHSMGAVTVLGLTFKQRTATPILVQVLPSISMEVNIACTLFDLELNLYLILFIYTPLYKVCVFFFFRCVSRAHDVHGGSRV